MEGDNNVGVLAGGGTGGKAIGSPVTTMLAFATLAALGTLGALGTTLRQPYANLTPTLRQPYANLTPTLRQPYAVYLLAGKQIFPNSIAWDSAYCC